MHQNQSWRLITCIWLHAGVIHLFANMLSLVFVGIRLEQQFGFGMNLNLIHPWIVIQLNSWIICFLSILHYHLFTILYALCSACGGNLPVVGYWWERTFFPFHPEEYLCWSFRCSLWTSWSNAVGVAY